MPVSIFLEFALSESPPDPTHSVYKMDDITSINNASKTTPLQFRANRPL